MTNTRAVQISVTNGKRDRQWPDSRVRVVRCVWVGFLLSAEACWQSLFVALASIDQSKEPH